MKFETLQTFTNIELRHNFKRQTYDRQTYIFTMTIKILSILFDGLTRVNQFFPSQFVLFFLSSLSIVICLKMCLKIDNLIRIL